MISVQLLRPTDESTRPFKVHYCWFSAVTITMVRLSKWLEDRVELPYLKKQNCGQCMTTFHETIYLRYHILQHRNLTYKIGNATHKKFLY